MASWSARGAPAGPPPPYDPELAPFATAFRETWPSVTPAMIPLLREPAALPRPTDEELALGGAFTVETTAVPGPAGAPEVELLICRPTGTQPPAGARPPTGTHPPAGARPPTGTHPPAETRPPTGTHPPAETRPPTGTRAPTAALYHLHGGGLFAGGARFDIGTFLGLAAELRLTVIAVEYRLAPETPYPGAVEDCYAGLLWIARNAADLNIDPARIVLEGNSGGAGLAAALALLTRDRGGPPVLGQMLLSPMLDDRNDTPSVAQLAGVALWDGVTNATAWNALLGDARGTPGISPYAAPARATDLSGLPDTFIDVGSVEIFRDEAISYATRLWQAGNAAELHVWAGAFHGFEHALPQASLSRDTMDARRHWLRRLLRDPGGPGRPASP